MSWIILFPIILGLVAAWLAWRPGMERPESPIRMRGIFRFLNFLGRTFQRVFHRPLLPLNPRWFDAKLRFIKKGESELYDSPDTPSEYHGLRALFAGFESPGTFLSTLGRIRMLRRIRRALKHREQILVYVKHHPQVLDLTILRPLIITGLPRSGTTFLQRLMATDPRARSPHLWVMMSDPSPQPPTKKEIEDHSDSRLKSMTSTYGIGRFISPDKDKLQRMSHAVQPTDIDEESNLMEECLWSRMGALAAGDDDSYRRWVLDENEDKTYMYRYVKVWLQIQTSVYAPNSHWLLKTPAHAYFLPTLEEVFPDANLVFIHRDPCFVVPSACRLSQMESLLTMDSQKFHLQWHGAAVLDALREAADRIRAFASGDSEMAQRAFHIQYETLVLDPIGMVEQIYRHFDYELTDEFRDNMRKHLKENRQHKHGKPDYSLEAFGLTEAQVNETFAEYNQTFRRQVEA